MVAEANRVDRLTADDPADVAHEILVRQLPRSADVHHLDAGAVTARAGPRAAGADSTWRGVEIALLKVGRDRREWCRGDLGRRCQSCRAG